MSRLSDSLASLGLSAQEVSRRTKLPLDRVEMIMAGGEAKLSDIRAFGAGLRVPKSFFSQSEKQGKSDQLRLLFRSTPQMRDGFDGTANRVADFVDAATQMLPPNPKSCLTVESEIGDTENFAVADSLARSFRTKFFHGDMTSPLTALPSILGDRSNVILAMIKESRFEGISLVQDGYVFIFISPRFSGRMLFTLAHELGHVLAHHVRPDRPYFEGAASIGNFNKTNQSERFVDAFASCLLLPRAGVLQFISLVRDQLSIPPATMVGDIEILYLARFYGVSFDVASRRCEDLRLLPAGGSYSLAEHIRKKHGSPEKRADEAGLPERTKLDFPLISKALQTAILDSVRDESVSAGWVADRIGISLSDIMLLHEQQHSR